MLIPWRLLFQDPSNRQPSDESWAMSELTPGYRIPTCPVTPLAAPPQTLLVVQMTSIYEAL